ncbi:MBL fold metallo-hydrolase [Lacibacter sp. H375]|uniref:MBL fold metallo-hydrolase n=1 Tax=Lacibacter sp. H375 TaxID=3133424 RepID=UPI0030C5FCFE
MFAGALLAEQFAAKASITAEPKSEIRLLRNATVVIKTCGLQILVDPMLSEKGQLDPIPWSNDQRNPLIDLPVSSDELQNIIDTTDIVLSTHLHPDHWDITATELLPKSKLIICQPTDETVLLNAGFKNIVSDENLFQHPIVIHRVPAQHGHGELLEKMSPTSGYIIKTNGQTIYITGDTVWSESLHNNLIKYLPDIVIANACAARFNFGEAITLTADDIVHIADSCKTNSKIIVVHMEAINHCLLQRKELDTVLTKYHLHDKVLVPNDGDAIII